MFVDLIRRRAFLFTRKTKEKKNKKKNMNEINDKSSFYRNFSA